MSPCVSLVCAAFVPFLIGASDPQDRLRVRETPAGSEIVVESGSGEHVLRRTARDVRELALREVPGAPVLAATWSEGSGADATGWYALSLDGTSFVEARSTTYELELRYARFDPTREVPAVAEWLDGERSGGRLWVVQYWTQTLEEYRTALRAIGATPHLFLAQHSNVCELDPEIVDDVRALPFVRAVTPFHPAYKLEEELLAELELGLAPSEPVTVNVLSLERGSAGQAPVLALARSLGGTVESVSEPTYLVTLTLPRANLAELARSDAVQWIDRWGAPEEDMNIARAFHGADYVESIGNYLGQGVRVEVLDGGCDISHPDLQNRIVHTTTVAGAHGTCTSGIVCGSGAGNFSARGVMPSSFLVVGYYNNLAGGSRYAHTFDLQDPADVYQCVLQSNSWGSSLTTAYNSISQNMDLILFDMQRISILQSQSNAGTQSSRPEAWAKNILSVGGIRHFNTESKADDSWTAGASIGPAADGRIKPDLASFYDATLCTDVVGSGGYATGNYYSSFGGTSGATPITAGHLGLAYQMWSDGVFGNATPGATVFENRPFNTTAKALLINTATQWTFSGTSHDLTRTHQGWGHADLRNLWDLRSSLYVVDESDVLANLASTTHPLTVAAGTAAFKATLVYRDRPGTTSSSQHRINDLDLEVTAPGGTVYRGNNGLLAGMWSVSGGVANTKDTVENVFVQSPAAGTWQVRVIARELNQDTHVETPALDADYALVVSGVATTPPTPPAAPSNLTATAISTGRVDLSWSDNSGDETGFEIERSTDGVNFAPLASVGANSTAHSDTTVAASTTYWYRVNATNGGGDSGYSNVASATTPTPAPPAAPSGLTATAISSGRIDLAWSDNSSDETSFGIERSTDGVNFAPLASVGANSTGHSDTTVAASTTYWYRVDAVNGAGASAWSNVASATTPAPSATIVHANGEIAVAGNVSGTFAATLTQDDGYEAITERLSGGKPANRYSYLEHKWTFSVPAGSTATLEIDAHHGVSSDGDDFVLAYSTNDSTYVDLLTVTKTSDDDVYQTAALPAGISGTVYVRVRDTVRTPGTQALDTVRVDDLRIRVE